MRKGYLTVQDLANAVGCHVNTVHLYETWGFLLPIPRDPKNQYRMYSEYHLEHFKLAYTALKYPYPGGKQVVLDLVEASKLRDLERALSLNHAYREQINAERTQAEAAIEVIEHWLSGVQVSSLDKPLWIGQAAELLDLTIDTLRSWERDGLVEVPRNPNNRYRLYGSEEIGRLRVVRVLVNAGYSHMAVLRLMSQLDAGVQVDLREILDTPRPDEEILHITDRWLSALEDELARCDQIETQIHRLMAIN